MGVSLNAVGERVVSLRIRGFAARRATPRTRARFVTGGWVRGGARGAASAHSQCCSNRARSPSGGGRRRGPGAPRPRRGEPAGPTTSSRRGLGPRRARRPRRGPRPRPRPPPPPASIAQPSGRGRETGSSSTRLQREGAAIIAIAARGTAACPLLRWRGRRPRPSRSLPQRRAAGAGRSANVGTICTPPESGAARRAATTSRPARTFTKFEVFTRLRARVVPHPRRRAGSGRSAAGPRPRAAPAVRCRPPRPPRPRSLRGRRRSRSS